MNLKIPKYFFDKNEAWVKKVTAEDPDFFKQLSAEQNPEYLWIGCSDSRVPANQILDLQPGELFVHRNIANIVSNTDLNCLSVIEYAVETLQVKHIIVCGHYGCGGIKAAAEGELSGSVGGWLQPLQKNIIRFDRDNPNESNAAKRLDVLCELNVIEQVRNVGNTGVVKKAWKNGVNLSVHGWIYNIKNGLLNDLGICKTVDSH